MRSLPFVLSLVAIFSVCSAAPKQAEVSRYEDFVGAEFLVEMPDGTFENLEFTGTMHLVWRSSDDGAGGEHTVINDDFRGIAIASDGTRYLFISSGRFSDNIKKGETITFLQKTKLLSQGKWPNSTGLIMMKVTINANGELAVEISR